MQEFDALVIGGGPAGCAASIRLARLGYNIAMAESRPLQFKIGESLPPAVKPLLAELGALSACDGARISFGNQSAWGSDRLDDTDFIRDPNGPGWHVDRACFEARLRSIAGDRGVFLLEPARVLSVSRTGRMWLAALNGEQESVSARWMIDCTGRTAAFAQSQNARRRHFDRLVAVAAVFECPDADRDSRTLVESAEMGWWYTSLIPGSRRVVVLHTDPAIPAFRTLRTVDGFLQALVISSRVSACIREFGSRMTGVPRIFVANSSRLDDVIGEGWIAAGDAAAAFDPLSSQGILTGLYSGIHAADTVHAGFQGASGAADRYRQIIDDVFDAYLSNRDRYYAMERRWSESLFWRPRSVLYNR